MLHTVTTECYWLLLTAPDCYWVLRSECYWVPLSATECYWVLLSATECYWVLLSVLLSATECYWVLLSATECWVLLSASECYWASATECYWVQLSATRNKSLSAFFEVYFSEWGSPLFVIGSVWIRPFKRLYIDIALTRNAGVLSPCTKPAHIPLSRTNQNDSPQQWKTKLNCCRMGFCFGSALLLARWLRKYRFKGFWRIYSPLLENKNSWPCLALLDTLSSWPSRPCFWSQHRFLVLVRIKLRHMPLDGYREGSQKSQNSLGLLATPPGASHCSQPLIFVKSHTHSCYCTHNSLCVTFNTHSCYCARNSLCVTNNRIRQSFTPYFYCKSGRMCRTRDDRRPLWRYDTKCHGWL